MQTTSSPPPSVQYLCIDEGSEGQRLDNFLIKTLKGVPKTHIHRIIRNGEVRVNKGRAQSSQPLAIGDMVRIPPVRVSESPAQKERLSVPGCEFPILFEDDYFLAIDKPAGVAVHGGSGVSFGVIEQLRRTRIDAKFLELVHRLDRETSGVLLIAKRRSALTSLQEQFKQRQTGKCYLALVLGHYPPNQKVLDAPLHKFLDSRNERRVKVTSKDDPNGMRAVTLVHMRQALASKVHGDVSLLEVTIKTGRTHQIRVHLTSAGYPIAGDDKYGDFERNKQLAKNGLKRMFLHAWRLQLTHPATGEVLTLSAELPPELKRFYESLSA